MASRAVQNLNYSQCKCININQHATSKGFFFGSNMRFIGGRQSTVTMVFTRCPREELEHSEENVGV